MWFNGSCWPSMSEGLGTVLQYRTTNERQENSHPSLQCVWREMVSPETRLRLKNADGGGPQSYVEEESM